MIAAGLRIEVHHRYSYIEKQCKDWKCPDTDGRPDIVAKVSEEEIKKEEEQLRASMSGGEEKQTAHTGAVSAGVCESICIYRAIAKELTAFDAFVMHCAVVELDGEAYVFAAKSGVGKTTHTRLWLEHFEGRAKYINGDKPIMRWIEGKLYACEGLLFSGTGRRKPDSQSRRWGNRRAAVPSGSFAGGWERTGSFYGYDG